MSTWSIGWYVIDTRFYGPSSQSSGPFKTAREAQKDCEDQVLADPRKRNDLEVWYREPNGSFTRSY
jgi:hypothetical protein